MFYWAGYYGQKKMIDNFLSIIGLSPFLKLFRHQNVIDGCVIGMQLEILEYLIKDTRQGINIGREEKVEPKYHIVDYMDLDYYWKSREGKDSFSNNSCHLCFKIEDEKLRYDILKLLIEEKCGDVNKPNNLGYLPHEVMHD